MGDFLLPLAPVIAIVGHEGDDNEQTCHHHLPHLQNPPACPSSILLLDRIKFAAAAFNMMLVDCCVRGSSPKNVNFLNGPKIVSE
jgi:hypothetical protein